MTPTPAQVTAVCVVHAIKPGHFHETAIDKRPRTARLRVDEAGLAGDEQRDRHHGGPDAAVYVYADEEAAFFAETLGGTPRPGLFGENLRTSGLDVSGARIGERWLVGDVLLEVRGPRTPCPNLSLHVGVPGFHRELHRSGRVGAMCRVLRPGEVEPGLPVVVDHVPDHGVTVADLSAGLSASAARELRDSGVDLAPRVRRLVLRRAAADPKGSGNR
jgi:MOSC domain-containing protein YiiM